MYPELAKIKLFSFNFYKWKKIPSILVNFIGKLEREQREILLIENLTNYFIFYKFVLKKGRNVMIRENKYKCFHRFLGQVIFIFDNK